MFKLFKRKQKKEFVRLVVSANPLKEFDTQTGLLERHKIPFETHIANLQISFETRYTKNTTIHVNGNYPESARGRSYHEVLS